MIPDDITWTPGSAVSGLISDLNNKSFMLKIVEHSFCYLTPKKSCLTHTSLNLAKKKEVVDWRSHLCHTFNHGLISWLLNLGTVDILGQAILFRVVILHIIGCLMVP